MLTSHKNSACVSEFVFQKDIIAPGTLLLVELINLRLVSSNATGSLVYLLLSMGYGEVFHGSIG